MFKNEEFCIQNDEICSESYQTGGDARSVGGESVAFSDLAFSDIASQSGHSQTGADSIDDSLEVDGELSHLQEMPSEEEDDQDDLQSFGDGDTSDGGALINMMNFVF